MNILREILAEAFLIREDASVNDINTAVNNMHPVRITYNGPSGEGRGDREIYPVAYGLSTAGNPVVRAFQPQGDTSTDVPAWKFFRIDRIDRWETDKSRHFDPGQLNGFNDKGDEQMATLYAISPIGAAKGVQTQKPEKEKPQPEKTTTSHPVTKGEVQNGGSDKGTESQYYTADDAVNDLLNTTIPKVSPLQNKNVDNVAGQDYNSRENQPAREPVPITKGEVGNADPAVNPAEKSDNLYADNGPVMKTEIQPNAEIQSNGELSRNFRDMTNRMDNLYNNEEEER